MAVTSEERLNEATKALNEYASQKNWGQVTLYNSKLFFGEGIPVGCECGETFRVTKKNSNIVCPVHYSISTGNTSYECSEFSVVVLMCTCPNCGKKHRVAHDDY